MRRRNFLIKAMQSSAITTVLPALLTACEAGNVKTDKSIIVVGAGISGLAAAEKLSTLGFEVTVLEAQEKVGGRLRSNRSLGIAFDEGASWIHGINKNPITELAQKAGMQSFHTDDEDILSYDIDGVLRKDALFSSTEDKFYDILEILMKSGSPQESFESVFNATYPHYANDRLWKFFLSTYVTFDTGDLSKLSSLLYNEGEEFSGIEKIAVNGYDTLAHYLAKGLKIQLNQQVSKINFSDNPIRVHHNGQVSEADYVIVTVPLGVLKQKSIQFLPLLPNKKLEAINNIGMNCVNKFLLTWEDVFWDDVQYVSYTPEIRDKFNYFVNVKKIHPAVNALMTFAYADYARQTETMTDAAIVAEIMTHLKDMYGSSIPEPTHFLRTRWGSNPNSYGAYSFTAVETQMSHFDEMAEAVENKLFFAGEHTEADYFSTVHGAYLSGIREANKIINLQ